MSVTMRQDQAASRSTAPPGQGRRANKTEGTNRAAANQPPFFFWRQRRRSRLGLALSSGGARSFAHIGVLQVLERHGIQVDAIAGTSMGAYIGALWASGVSADRIEQLGLAMAHPWALWRLVDPVLPPRQGFIRGERVVRLLRASIGQVRFDDLRIPLHVIGTDLETMDRVVFNQGDVAQAVHASLAMPGIFTPVSIDGRTVVDGGVSDPLPVDVLRDQGIDRVIAVNTIPNSAELRAALRQGLAEAHRHKRWWRRAREAATQRVNYFAHFNILDVIWRCLQGQQSRHVEYLCARADVVLRAVTHDGVWHDFARADRYIRLGREIATDHLDQIRALVRP